MVGSGELAPSHLGTPPPTSPHSVLELLDEGAVREAQLSLAEPPLSLYDSLYDCGDMETLHSSQLCPRHSFGDSAGLKIIVPGAEIPASLLSVVKGCGHLHFVGAVSREW